jgi:hypothetical protein
VAAGPVDPNAQPQPAGDDSADNDDRNGKDRRDGSTDRRFQTKLALIGVVGAVLAATVGAVIGLQPWSSGPPAPSPTSSGSARLDVSISAVQYPIVEGKKVIQVEGTVQDQTAEEEVYAFAGNEAGVPPFYPSDPATIRGGVWTAEITNYHGSPGSLAVWAGILAVPPRPSPCLNCIFDPNATLMYELATAGPRAAALRKVTLAFH